LLFPEVVRHGFARINFREFDSNTEKCGTLLFQVDLFQDGVEAGIIAQRVVSGIDFDRVDVGSVLGAGMRLRARPRTRSRSIRLIPARAY